jgi:hypothetical protein
MDFKIMLWTMTSWVMLIGPGPVAACPSSHLEPTLRFGRAFGNPVKATTDVDVGPLGEDEEWVFQYFEYQSRESREPGYASMFGVHVLRDSTAKTARVFVARLKDGKPVLVQAPLSMKATAAVIAMAWPIVHDTHYRKVACDAEYLDGHVIQVGVAGRSGWSSSFIGGEAYGPIQGTPVYQLQLLGRALKSIATGTMAESGLKSVLGETGQYGHPRSN